MLAIPLLLGALLSGGAADPCWTRAPAAELASRSSPLDSAVARLGDAEIKVCYNRPSARGRTVFGDLVPFGERWRLGANEATTIQVSVPVRFGDLTLKPGIYSLYAIPRSTTWEIVVNAAVNRWGIPLNALVRAQDVGTVTAKSEATDAPIETLTMRLEPAGDGSVVLVTEWERTRVRVSVRKAQ